MPLSLCLQAGRRPDDLPNDGISAADETRHAKLRSEERHGAMVRLLPLSLCAAVSHTGHSL